jgi:hypothetical protein
MRKLFLQPHLCDVLAEFYRVELILMFSLWKVICKLLFEKHFVLRILCLYKLNRIPASYPCSVFHLLVLA